MSKSKKTSIAEGEVYEVIRERRVKQSTLFGLITWTTLLSQGRIGYNLHIAIDPQEVKTTDVYINGKLIDKDLWN